MGNGVVSFSDYDNDTIPEIQHIFIQPYQVDDNYTFTLQYVFNSIRFGKV